MYFTDEPEHIGMLRETLARFVAAEMPRDKVREWDRAHTFPPEVFRKLRREIPSCAERFAVRPGLTGHAQFLTPSRTPKRIRFAIDNYWVRERHNPWRELVLIAWTIAVVLRKTLVTLGRKLATKMRIFRKRHQLEDERAVRRYHAPLIAVQFTDPTFADRLKAPIHIHDINHEAFCFFSEEPVPENQTFHFWLVGFEQCAHKPTKRARCCGYRFRQAPAPTASEPNRNRYVIFYEPISPRHRYLVDNYVLHEMVA